MIETSLDKSRRDLRTNFFHQQSFMEFPLEIDKIYKENQF